MLKLDLLADSVCG